MQAYDPQVSVYAAHLTPQNTDSKNTSVEEAYLKNLIEIAVRPIVLHEH